MQYTFIGKNTVVSDSIKERTQAKLNRLEKLLPDNVELVVSCSVTKLDHKLEVTIPLQKRILRAEVTAPDMYVAIDEIVDILEKQILKYKGRLRHKSRKNDSFKDEYNFMIPYESGDKDKDAEDAGIRIDKTKRFALKPMDAEEAAMEMELLGHNFYVFRNGSSDEVNVVYRRKDGSYGLIEPEF